MFICAIHVCIVHMFCVVLKTALRQLISVCLAALHGTIRMCWYALHGTIRMCWYALQVILFQLVGVIFPSSDFRHPITTPAMISMGQILLKVKFVNIEFSVPNIQKFLGCFLFCRVP